MVKVTKLPVAESEAEPDPEPVEVGFKEEEDEEEVLNGGMSAHVTSEELMLRSRSTYMSSQLRSYNGLVLAAVMTPKLGFGVVGSASWRVYQ